MRVNNPIQKEVELDTLAQIEQLEATFKAFDRSFGELGPTYDSERLGHRVLARGRVILENVSPPHSPLLAQLNSILQDNENTFVKAQGIVAIAQELREDLKNGRLTTFKELIHGNLFDDYLEMASHLLEEKFKDAAAVIAGSTFESHVRQLCTKYDISTTYQDKRSKNRPEKLSNLNIKLCKAGVFNDSVRSSNESVIHMRNYAAHGRYSEFDDKDVEKMIATIRSFRQYYPA